MLTLHGLVGVVGIGVLQGALVAAPRAGALGALERLRSRGWAALLPAAIVVGTFSVLAVPRIASGFVLLGFVATPALAAVAATTVVAGAGRRLLLAFAGIGLLALLGSGWIGQISRTLVTALGCLTVGTILVRLVPRSCLPIAVLSMSLADVLLLGLGIGQPASAVIAGAAAHVPTPAFDQARIGPIATDYPDLILAAVLGSTVAGEPIQRRGAALLAALAAGYGLLLPLTGALPATVPIALAFVLIRWGPRRPALTPRAQEAPA